MLTSFPVPPFFIGPDKTGDAFQALDEVTGSPQIGLELGDPVLDFRECVLAPAQGGNGLLWYPDFVHTSVIGNS
jgi:hypothetical protein